MPRISSDFRRMPIHPAPKTLRDQLLVEIFALMHSVVARNDDDDDEFSVDPKNLLTVLSKAFDVTLTETELRVAIRACYLLDDDPSRIPPTP